MEDKKFKKQLESIIIFKMNDEEAKAFKLSLLWKEIAEHVFPDLDLYRGTHFRKQTKKPSDPRNSYLFKCCYTMLEQTKHKLKNNEYKLFIKAQLDILKNISSKDGILPDITPRVLLGEKAWNRWLKWKSVYNARKTIAAEKVLEKDIPEKIKSSLEETKEILKQKLPNLTKDNILKSLENKAMLRWSLMGVISSYYLLLSPIVHKWMSENNLTYIEYFYIDPNLFKVEDSVKQFFEELFDYEF